MLQSDLTVADEIENKDLQFYLNLWLFSRHLKEMTAFLKQGKIKGGFTSAATNLAVVGLKIAGIVLTAGGTELLGAGTALAEVGGVGGGVTLAQLSADGIAVPVAENLAAALSPAHISKHVKVKAAAIVVVKSVLCIETFVAIINGLKQAARPRDGWDKQKEDVIKYTRPVIGAVDELLKQHVKVINITWVGSKIPLKKKTVLSTQIKEKYQKRCEEFHTEAASNEKRKGRNIPTPAAAVPAAAPSLTEYL